MPIEPIVKRASVFIDGQNLFHACKEAYGYTYPNYDPLKLSKRLCQTNNWQLERIGFYTGVPSIHDNRLLHLFWTNKLAIMKTRGIYTYSRSIKYNIQNYISPSGEVLSISVGREKGIDVRIAIDAVRMARKREYNVCLIMSQDQDLSEVADEIRSISIEQMRWIKVASAYPVSASRTNRRGINNTQWLPFDKEFYDTCIDPFDYRPKTEAP